MRTVTYTGPHRRFRIEHDGETVVLVRGQAVEVEDELAERLSAVIGNHFEGVLTPSPRGRSVPSPRWSRGAGS